MRTGQPLVARPAWHDRNPIVRNLAAMENTVAPHGATDRWTYTVPAGKKAFIEAVELTIQRHIAASTVGLALSQLMYTPSGGSAYPLFKAQINTNNVGDKDTFQCGNAGVLLPGDLLKGQTYDGSTGGQTNYVCVAKVMEFDA